MRSPRQIQILASAGLFKAKHRDSGCGSFVDAKRIQSRVPTFKEWDKSKAAVINIDAVFGSRFSRERSPAVQLTDGTPVPSLLRAGQSARVSMKRDVSSLRRSDVVTAAFPPRCR